MEGMLDPAGENDNAKWTERVILLFEAIALVLKLHPEGSKL